MPASTVHLPLPLLQSFQATVYSLFRGDATEHDLADFGHKGR